VEILAPKIVIVGAGSHVFARRLITDILSYPELRASEIALVDIDQNSLNIMTAFVKKVVEQHGFNTSVSSTTNRREALQGADYVIDAIRVGAFEASRLDIEIPARYGVIQGAGVTIGPGGVFYALRNVPAVIEICRDMEELCRHAWLLNYTDPLTTICWALNDCTKIKNVGLCHSVVNTATELAGYLGAPFGELSYWVAGINHMAWFLELNWKGTDAYPILRERFRDPEVYSKPDRPFVESDVVRAEIFKAFGYFNTEGSQHMSEFVPYFRKRPELFEKYRLVNRLDILAQMQALRKTQQEELKQFTTGSEIWPISKSGEFCADIIDSIETGKTRRVYGNVKNTGLITNLPNDSCVEVPCLVDKTGVHPCYVGPIPPQCAALNRTNLNVEELAAMAAVEKSRELVFQAVLLDPLTSAMLTIDEIRKMVDEMFELESRYLEGFVS
jgi:alpha-galactosidase